MPRKPKFRPRITRVKLNPEQAVLACSCYAVGLHGTHVLHRTGWTVVHHVTGHNPCIGKFLAAAGPGTGTLSISAGSSSS